MKISISYLLEKGLVEESPAASASPTLRYKLSKMGRFLGKEFAEELYRGTSEDSVVLHAMIDNKNKSNNSLFYTLTAPSAGISWDSGTGPRLQLRRSARTGKETTFLRPGSQAAGKWEDIPTSAKQEKGKIPKVVAIASAIDFRIGVVQTPEEVEDDNDDDDTAEMTPEAEDNGSEQEQEQLRFPPLLVRQLSAARGLIMEEVDSVK
jgi:hypothetical protein